MADALTYGERSTITAIIDNIQRRSRGRRRAARSGWALLVTAGLSLPVLAGAIDGSITLTTALVRIGLALTLSLFVASTVGSMMDHYQTQAALTSVEDALLAARGAAASEPTDSTDDDQPDN